MSFAGKAVGNLVVATGIKAAVRILHVVIHISRTHPFKHRVSNVATIIRLGMRKPDPKLSTPQVILWIQTFCDYPGEHCSKVIDAMHLALAFVYSETLRVKLREGNLVLLGLLYIGLIYLPTVYRSNYGEGSCISYRNSRHLP